MSDSIHLRGPGGGVFEFTPPLHSEIRKQFDARKLTQVNADGSAYEGAPWTPDAPEEDDGSEESDPEGDDTAAPKRGRGSKAAAEGA